MGTSLIHVTCNDHSEINQAEKQLLDPRQGDLVSNISTLSDGEKIGFGTETKMLRGSTTCSCTQQ